MYVCMFLQTFNQLEMNLISVLWLQLVEPMRDGLNIQWAINQAMGLQCHVSQMMFSVSSVGLFGVNCTRVLSLIIACTIVLPSMNFV